jgi:hypothetical protein
MTKRVVTCGDGGDGNKCMLLDYDSIYDNPQCRVDYALIEQMSHPCHCPEAREARLRAQLGDSMVTTTTDKSEAELVALVREAEKFTSDVLLHLRGPKLLRDVVSAWRTRARKALRKKGVDV